MDLRRVTRETGWRFLPNRPLTRQRPRVDTRLATSPPSRTRCESRRKRLGSRATVIDNAFIGHARGPVPAGRARPAPREREEAGSAMIPGQFDYVRPGDLDESAGDPQGPRGRGEAPVRGLQPHPADQAPTGPAGPARRHARPDRAWTASSRPTTSSASAPGDAPPDPRERDRPGPLPGHRRPVGRHRRPAGPQLGHDRRLRGPRRPGQRLAGGPAGGQRHDRVPERHRRAGDRAPATSSSTPSRPRSSRPRS